MAVGGWGLEYPRWAVTYDGGRDWDGDGWGPLVNRENSEGSENHSSIRQVCKTVIVLYKLEIYWGGGGQKKHKKWNDNVIWLCEYYLKCILII